MSSRLPADLEPVYLWVDGVYVKAGLEKDKAVMLVVLAGLRDGRKIVLAVASGYRQSIESWAAWLRELKHRGRRPPRLVVGDGHLGIWGALTAVFPPARQQRCWNHRLLNVLDKLRKRLQAEGRRRLAAIPYAETRADAERQKRCVPGVVHEEGRQRSRPGARPRLGAAGHLPRIPEGAREAPANLSNPIESPFAAVRLRAPAAKRYKKVENATAVIWRTLLLAGRTFRRLDGPELLAGVAEGVTYVNGVRAKASPTAADEQTAA